MGCRCILIRIIRMNIEQGSRKPCNNHCCRTVMVNNEPHSLKTWIARRRSVTQIQPHPFNSKLTKIQCSSLWNRLLNYYGNGFVKWSRSLVRDFHVWAVEANHLAVLPLRTSFGRTRTKTFSSSRLNQRLFLEHLVFQSGISLPPWWICRAHRLGVQRNLIDVSTFLLLKQLFTAKHVGSVETSRLSPFILEGWSSTQI